MRSQPNAVEIGLLECLDEYYNSVCCVVSPFTKTHFSRPIIESFLHKKPVISSSVDGIEEVVENNVNGLIFKKGNPKELAQKINTLAKEPDTARKMGFCGFEKAVLKFTKKNVYKIIDIYTTVLNDQT
jgi:glycosyltransferase involved in cell wall biosynthesis